MTSKRCSIVDCPQPVRCKELCGIHYNRWIRTGQTGPAGLLHHAPLTDADVLAMHARYQDGLTARQVAAEFGYPHSTVLAAFRRYQLPVRKVRTPSDTEIIRRGDFCIVQLGGKRAQGRVAKIDEGDRELVGAHCWNVYESKRPGRRPEGPYAQGRVRVDGRWKPINMHVLITGYAMTDHINHDGLDNRRANLRPATTAQNSHNSRPQSGSSSKYKGVSWVGWAGKWRAVIVPSGRARQLGFFDSEEEAAIVYNAAAQELYGEYAYLNEVRAR